MKDYLIQLLDYELWANRRIIDALETLNNPPARAMARNGPYFVGSARLVWPDHA